MAERPILMSAPMVRATLAGTKTQTRRVAVKTSRPDVVVPTDFDKEECLLEIENKHSGRRVWKPCPYGRPGDRLWVREAWCPIYPQDPHYNGGHPIGIDYKASHSRDSDQWRVMDDLGTRRWKPSIHMPRWASRVLLEITAVRVEQLQDISEADSLAEGINCYPFRPDDGFPVCDGYTHKQDDGTCGLWPTAREAYKDLWEQINGAGKWDTNPWVWVIEFRRLQP